jgi:hypothetical protein
VIGRTSKLEKEMQHLAAVRISVILSWILFDIWIIGVNTCDVSTSMIWHIFQVT